MDYIPYHMSQFDQISTDHQELFHMISTLPCKLDPLDHQIHVPADKNHEQINPPSTPSFDLSLKRRRRSDDQENPDEKKKKKVIHREIERMRRKEMAGLCANLRSLIPLEYLKGKRSVSDQMCVATNYIQELQRKNRELASKRDEMKKVFNRRSINDDDKSSKARDSGSTSVSVGRSRAGIEVVVNTALERGISLTTLLRALAGEGLDVIGCVSATVRGRFLHSIESEIVTDEKSFELSNLEEKLKDLVV